MRSQLKLQGLLATALLVGGLSGSCSSSSNFAIAPEDPLTASTTAGQVSLLQATDTVTLDTPLGNVLARQIRVEVQAPNFPVAQFEIGGATFTPVRRSPAGVTRYAVDSFQDGGISLAGTTTFTLPGIDHTCVIIRNRLGNGVLSESTACGAPPPPTPPPPSLDDLIPGPSPVCPDFIAQLPPFSNQISIDNVTEFETPGIFEFTITLVRGTDPNTGLPFAGDVTVDVSTRDDIAQDQMSATAPIDYLPIPTNPNDPLPFVRFEDDGQAVQERQVIVNALADNVVELEERFLVDLSNACNFGFGTNPNNDNNLPTITIPTGVGTIRDGEVGGAGDFEILLTTPQTFTELQDLTTLRPRVVGAIPPFTFQLTPDSLQTLGIIFDGTLFFDTGIGTISGTPNLDPTFLGTPANANRDLILPVGLTVTDAAGQQATEFFQLVILTNDPELTYPSPVTLTQFEIGQSDAPEVMGGDEPFVYTAELADGSPLSSIGLTIEPNSGVISGAPTASGQIIANVTVTDFDQDTDTNTISIEIEAADDLGVVTADPSPVVFAAGTETGDIQTVTLTPSVAPEGGSLVLDIDDGGLGALGELVSPTGNILNPPQVTFPQGSSTPQTIVLGRLIDEAGSGSGFITITQNSDDSNSFNYPDGSINLAVPVTFEAGEVVASANVTVAPTEVTFAAGTAPGAVQIVTLTPTAAPIGNPLILNVTASGSLTGVASIVQGATVTFPVGSSNPQSVVLQRDAAITDSGAGFISIVQDMNSMPVNFPVGGINIPVSVTVEAEQVAPLTVGAVGDQSFTTNTNIETPPILPLVMGGQPPFTFTLITPGVEDLFAGDFNFNPANGIISGTVDTAGTRNVTIQIQDSAGAIVFANYQLEVIDP